MINIYDRKETSFTHNGVAILNECVECKVTEKINDLYELNLTYPFSSPKASYIQQYNIIKANGQLFRVYNTVRDSKAKTVKAQARHIFYDLLYNFIEDTRPENKTCEQALEIILTAMLLQDTYTFSSDITDLKTQYVVSKNGVEAIFLLVEEWQGELVRNNFDIQINKNKGSDKGVLIKYGKNIVGITETLNTDDIVTMIYPVGANGITLPDKYILSDVWQGSDYPVFPLIKRVDFSDVGGATELRTKAQEYMDVHALPKVNYKIDFVQLAQTEEYKNYKVLEQVEVGDIVTVRHSILGIDIKVEVIGIERDLLSAKNTKVELGQPLSTLDQYIDKVARNSNSLIDSVTQSLTSILYYTNPSMINLATVPVEVIYMPISTVRNTNVMSYLLISANASTICTLNFTYYLDNSAIPMTLKQKLQAGDNLVAIPLPLVQLEEGAHYFSLKLNVDAGTLVIPATSLQFAVEGRNLTGGLSTDRPHAEVVEQVKYVVLNANKLSTTYTITHPTLTPVAFTQDVLYTNVSEGKITESVNIILA